jgi:hypothetical protein
MKWINLIPDVTVVVVGRGGFESFLALASNGRRKEN